MHDELTWFDDSRTNEVLDLDDLAATNTSNYISVVPSLLSARHGRLFGIVENDEIWKYHFHQRPVVHGRATSVAGGELVGLGYLRRHNNIVAPPGALPGYLSRPFLNGTYKTSIWSSILTKENLERVVVDHPIASVLHPNMVYGHFLLEILPRIYLIRILIDMGLAVKVAWSSRLPAWATQFARMLLPERDFITYDHENQILEAPSFILPSMLQDNYRYHPSFNNLSEELSSGKPNAPRSSSNAIADYKSGRLFLSRKHHHSAKQGIKNQAEVEDALAKLGFFIFAPEQHSIELQLEVYRRTTIVVSDYNSAVHNSLFMPFGSTVLLLNWLNWYQHSLCGLRNQNLRFLVPSDGKFRTWHTRGTDDAWYTVDISRLRAELDLILGAQERRSAITPS